MCIFGTTPTIIDGYAPTNTERLRLIFNQQKTPEKALNLPILLTATAGLTVIFYFNNAVGAMLKFAMVASFVSTSIFAWLHLSLVLTSQHKVRGWLLWLAILA